MSVAEVMERMPPGVQLVAVLGCVALGVAAIWAAVRMWESFWENR